MTTSAAEQRPKKDLRYYSLDFWRGVACLSVTIFHSTFYITENPARIPGDFLSKKLFSLMSYGWVGVPLFFVISGYCIAAACESVGITGTSMSRYFFRRFKRIFPPYWIALLCLLAVHFLSRAIAQTDFLSDKIVPMAAPETLSPWQWFGSITLTEVWRDHIVGPGERLFLGPAWSLCYEEQFYAVCGVLLLLRRRWFYKGMAALTVAVALILIYNHTVAMLPVSGFFFDGRWLMFAAGVLVFYCVQVGRPDARKWALILLGVALAVVTIWALKTQRNNAAKELAFSFAFAFILIPLQRRDRQIFNSRILRPVTFCGGMCYSFYLVHMPVVKGVTQLFYRMGVTHEWPTILLTIPVTVLVTAGAAWLFYMAVERRFLNSRPSNPAPALVPLPVPIGATASNVAVEREM
jgi:peptidoglycan/LPS O-acetylase OafA/YrhL